jgi:hypothetical protein
MCHLLAALDNKQNCNKLQNQQHEIALRCIILARHHTHYEVT